MPENVAPRSGAPAAGPGNRGKGAYQDRDKPAQIRFSNISAAKGIALPAAVRARGAGRVPFLAGCSALGGSSLCRARPPARPRAWRPLDTPRRGSGCPIVFSRGLVRCASRGCGQQQPKSRGLGR